MHGVVKIFLFTFWSLLSNCGRCGLKSDLHAYELLVVTKIMTLEV